LDLVRERHYSAAAFLLSDRKKGHKGHYTEPAEDLKFEFFVRSLIAQIGDVCLSRRKHGRHVVVPLHADISVICRKIGFDNLNPIKKSNNSLSKVHVRYHQQTGHT
jgi:hypothetical protein